MERQSIVIEYRLGSEDRVPVLAAELVRLEVDVIVALTTTDVRSQDGESPRVTIPPSVLARADEVIE